MCSIPTQSQAGLAFLTVSASCTGNFLSTSSTLNFGWGDGNGANLNSTGALSISVVPPPILPATQNGEHVFASSGASNGLSVFAVDSNDLSSTVFQPISLGSPVVTITNPLTTYSVNQTSTAQTFAAQVTNATSQTVVWSISGPGTIDPATGIFSVSPPLPNPAVPPQPVAKVTATWSYPAVLGEPPVVISPDTIAITAPFLSIVTSAPVSFGSLVVDTSAIQPVSIQNTGNATLHLGVVGTGGSSDFVAVTAPTNPCGATLAPSATCNLGVQFQPTTAGNKSATLSIASDNVGRDRPSHHHRHWGRHRDSHGDALHQQPFLPQRPGWEYFVFAAGYAVEPRHCSADRQFHCDDGAIFADEYLRNLPGNRRGRGNCVISVTFSPTSPGAVNGGV